MKTSAPSGGCHLWIRVQKGYQVQNLRVHRDKIRLRASAEQNKKADFAVSLFAKVTEIT